VAAAVNNLNSDTEVGPQPLTKAMIKIDEQSYGGALHGEGSAMVAFLVEDTNVDIPC